MRQITDNLDELFDLVDEDDTVIGQASRSECHSNPELIHRAVFIVVQNSQNQIFMQKRSRTKDTCPGMWTVSVSGHVTSGQSYEQAALREMQEEISISLPIAFHSKHLWRYSEQSEYSAIYLATSEGPFALNPLEVETGAFSSLAQIRNELDNNLAGAAKRVIDAVFFGRKDNR